MTDLIEAGKDMDSKDAASLGSGTLVFVGGMALAAASFLIEHYVIKSLKRS